MDDNYQIIQIKEFARGYIAISDNLCRGDYLVKFTNRHALKFLLLLLKNVYVKTNKIEIPKKTYRFIIDLDHLKLGLGLNGHSANEYIDKLCNDIFFSGFCLKSDLQTIVIPFFKVAVFNKKERTVCCEFSENAQPLLLSVISSFAQLPSELCQYIKNGTQLLLYLNLYFHQPIGQWVVSFSELKKIIGCESKMNMNDTRSSNNILTIILGLRRPKGWEYSPNTENQPWINEGILKVFSDYDRYYNYYAYPVYSVKGTRLKAVRFIIEKKKTAQNRLQHSHPAYYERIYNKIKDKIAEDMDDALYNVYCEQISYGSYDHKSNTLSLHIPSPFIREQMMQLYPEFETMIQREFPKGLVIDYVIMGTSFHVGNHLP